MVIVQFVKRYRIYNIGEIAGFSSEEAKRLIEKGKAIKHDPKREHKTGKPGSE